MNTTRRDDLRGVWQCLGVFCYNLPRCYNPVGRWFVRRSFQGAFVSLHYALRGRRKFRLSWALIALQVLVGAVEDCQAEPTVEHTARLDKMLVNMHGLLDDAREAGLLTAQADDGSEEEGE